MCLYILGKTFENKPTHVKKPGTISQLISGYSSRDSISASSCLIRIKLITPIVREVIAMRNVVKAIEDIII